MIDTTFIFVTESITIAYVTRTVIKKSVLLDPNMTAHTHTHTYNQPDNK
jgi:hypothetical protein